MKQEISLSPKAVGLINEMLSCGKIVEIDINRKTGELMIFEKNPGKLKYRVVVTER